MKNNEIKKILVTGGAGYVGAVLVPELLKDGYAVNVLDLYLYGDHVLDSAKNDKKLTEIKGDIRDAAVVKKAVEGCDAVIHLACISNDPSFELDPNLGRSINLDSFVPVVKASKEAGVKRFIYASSSSVYGIKEGVEVTEDLSLEPLTDYSKFKAECEKLLEKESTEEFITCTVRPATVCGYSPRQRLDVVVNILTNLAYNTGEIKIFGGSQLRPNIHIKDMADVYKLLLTVDEKVINKNVYNAGYENHTVSQLAEIVKSNIEKEVKLTVCPTDDLRSYHVNSDKISNELGFKPSYKIDDAVKDLVQAFKDNKLEDSLNNPRYFNIKMMQKNHLK